MQYSIATAVSTILVASALTSAAVIPRVAGTESITEIDLLMKTGDGDASVGREILKNDFGFLLTADSNGQNFDGVSLRMTTAGAQCGIFDPTTAAPLNGLVFNSTSDDANFGKNGSEGEVDSSAADAVSVAICCDVQASFAKTCTKPKPKSTGSSSASTTTTSTSSATATASASGKNTGFFSVEMQLSGLSELSVPGTVLANGQPQPIRNAVGIQTIHITKQHQPVQCLAFSDLAGKHQVGNAFNVKKAGVTFTDFSFQAGVDVNAVACKPIA